jgi:hypothetical protein
VNTSQISVLWGKLTILISFCSSHQQSILKRLFFYSLFPPKSNKTSSHKYHGNAYKEILKESRGERKKDIDQLKKENRKGKKEKKRTGVQFISRPIPKKTPQVPEMQMVFR